VMDQLVKKFMPRFVTLARERLRGAIEAANASRFDRAEVLAHDMHALAGEAGLLGLEDVVTLAREAEQAAKRFGSTSSVHDIATFVDALKALEQGVDTATERIPS
jgi:HPt (histidine-containing phosphotransfer) domain-containing protein